MNPSYDFSEIFVKDTQGSNKKSTEDSESTVNSSDANDSIANSSDIKLITGTSTAFSKSKLDLPTDKQEEKPVARSRKSLRHGFNEGFRELNHYLQKLESKLKNSDVGKKMHDGTSNDSNSSNKRDSKLRLDSNYQRHHKGGDKEELHYTKGWSKSHSRSKDWEEPHSDSQHDRETRIDSSFEKRKRKLKKSHSSDVRNLNDNNKVFLNNSTNDKGVSRSINNKRKRQQRKKLALVSFNKVLTNNNINNNNNAVGAYNYNSVDGGLMNNGVRPGQHNCFFVVCLGLYVNDAILNKPNQSISNKIESYENMRQL